MKLIYAAALATALTVPSLAKASVVDEGDVISPNNFVDFLVTDENEPNFSYLASLSPTTFTISTNETSQTPILLSIEDFYGGSGGASLTGDPPGGIPTGGTWLIDGGVNQTASGTFSFLTGVFAFEAGFIGPTDFLFDLSTELLSPEEGPPPNQLFFK